MSSQRPGKNRPGPRYTYSRHGIPNPKFDAKRIAAIPDKEWKPTAPPAPERPKLSLEEVKNFQEYYKNLEKATMEKEKEINRNVAPSLENEPLTPPTNEEKIEDEQKIPDQLLKDTFQLRFQKLLLPEIGTSDGAEGYVSDQALENLILAETAPFISPPQNSGAIVELIPSGGTHQTENCTPQFKEKLKTMAFKSTSHHNDIATMHETSTEPITGVVASDILGTQTAPQLNALADSLSKSLSPSGRFVHTSLGIPHTFITELIQKETGSTGLVPFLTKTDSEKLIIKFYDRAYINELMEVEADFEKTDLLDHVLKVSSGDSHELMSDLSQKYDNVIMESGINPVKEIDLWTSFSNHLKDFFLTHGFSVLMSSLEQYTSDVPPTIDSSNEHLTLSPQEGLHSFPVRSNHEDDRPMYLLTLHVFVAEKKD